MEQVITFYFEEKFQKMIKIEFEPNSGMNTPPPVWTVPEYTARPQKMDTNKQVYCTGAFEYFLIIRSTC